MRRVRAGGGREQCGLGLIGGDEEGWGRTACEQIEDVGVLADVRDREAFLCGI